MAQLVARLVRNEKVGGSNPPSSTTGRHPIRMSVFCMPGRVRAVPVVVLLVAPLVFRAPEGPAAREARRPHFVRRRASKPARALRSLRRPPHQWYLVADVWRVVSKPGQAPPPPTGTAAWPSGLAGALHTSGAWPLMSGSARCLEARPGPAAAHRHGARVSAWTVTVAFDGARANLVCDFRQVLFIAILRRLHFAVFECVSPTGWLFRKGDVMVGDTWRQFPRFYLCMSLVTCGAIYGCE